MTSHTHDVRTNDVSAARASGPGRPMSVVVDDVTTLLEPVLAAAGFDLVAVEAEALGSPAAVLRVLLDRAPHHVLGPRIDLDGVAEATRVVESVIDADDDLVPGRYSLEVSSPGLERPLRTPAHFIAAIGRQVAVKTRPGVPGERRVEGRLDAADQDPSGAITLAGAVIAYDAIERARTVVDWGPPPKPGSRPPAGRGPGRDRSPRQAGATPTRTAVIDLPTGERRPPADPHDARPTAGDAE